MPKECPSKQVHLSENDLQLPWSTQARKLVAQHDRRSLASLALTWLDETPRSTGSDEENLFEDVQEELAERRVLYEQLRDEEGTAGRSWVVRAMQKDWRDGLTYRQVAQLDMQHFRAKGTCKSWTAYRAELPSSPVIASSAHIFAAFRESFGAYHPHYLHLATFTSPAPLTVLRLQLIPSPSLTSRTISTFPSPICLLHLPLTPYVLLPTSLSSALRPLILQAFSTSLTLSDPAVRLTKLDLEGKDWTALREVLLARKSAVGEWRKVRGEEGKEVDGRGVLVPQARGKVVQDPTQLPLATLKATGVPALPQPGAGAERARKRRRLEEVNRVFGTSASRTEQAKFDGELPKLERLDYSISLPYPSEPSFPPPDVPFDPSTHPPFLVRLEGWHVLCGLRALVASGLTEVEAETKKEDERGGKGGERERRTPGLPTWLGEVAGEGQRDQGA
ncbi:CHL4 family chromosome segregation protein [Rhodotorula toruloides]|uniref:CHL4 family chromosome segregation protein n=1 Tax=Rhodotorula toruloides TaxID=5286 RepID=A0A511KE31_RHOTO|nr:CHL4 family chromosome segregation protein [Rhodotorula toruloides]